MSMCLGVSSSLNSIEAVEGLFAFLITIEELLLVAGRDFLVMLYKEKKNKSEETDWFDLKHCAPLLPHLVHFTPHASPQDFSRGLGTSIFTAQSGAPPAPAGALSLGDTTKHKQLLNKARSDAG